MAAQRIYKPYKAADAPLNQDGLLEAVVAVDLNDIIETDFEGFLDMISYAVLDDALLSDVSYSVVGTDHGSILIQVSGYIYD